MKRYTDYQLCLYTDVRFGKGAEKLAGEMVKKHGGTTVMLVYGGASAKKSGLYDRVVHSLDEAGIQHVDFGGVRANPYRSFAEKGIAAAKAEGVDFLLAMGGGSVIDTAKGIALGLKYDGPFNDLHSKKAVPAAMEKVGAIPTIAAAGSEMSAACVIVDDVETGLKRGVTTPGVEQPVFCLLNPELTYSVSPYQTGAGAADIFSHTFERYFVRSQCRLGDEFALGLLRTVVRYGPIAVKDPENYEARAELQLAAAFSHNGLTNMGHNDCTFPVHGLESWISGHYDTAHGAGLACLMPAWLESIGSLGDEKCLARIARFGLEVFGVPEDGEDLQWMVRETVDRFRTWLKRLGMPLTLRELGVPKEDIPELLGKIAFNAQGVLPGYVDLTREEVKKLFESVAG